MGLEELFQLWNDFVEGLVENKDNILLNPILWIGIVVIVIGLFALYDVPERTDKNSLGNVIRQLLQMMLDASEDIINAIRSITGFIGVVKLLLFGKIDPRTQLVLNNYAIIFLSMASFYTTFRGLSKIMGWPIAALVSFGIQVSILILVTYTIFLYKKQPKERRFKRLYFEKNDEKWKKYIIQPCTVGNITIKKSKDNPVQSDWNQKLIKIGKTCITIMLIIISVAGSSFFSYLYMFEKLVMPGITLDDYTRSINVVSKVAEEYSQELKEYQTGIVQILQTYNSLVPERLDFVNENPKNIQNQMEELNRQIGQLNDRVSNLRQQQDIIDNTGGDTAEIIQEIVEATNILEDYEMQLESIENTIREDTNYQYKLQAVNAIEKLNLFYSNPLYLMGDSDNSTGQDIQVVNSLESELIRAFGELNEAVALLEPVEEMDRLSSMERRSELTNAFNNYVQLSKYYAQNGRNGLDLTIVNEASQNQSVTLQEYDRIKTGINVVGDDQMLAGKNQEERWLMADEYLRNKGNDILHGIISTLNNVPQLESVINIWKDNIIVKAPNKTSFLDNVYAMYRDNSGQVETMERAFRKLFSKDEQYRRLSWQAALLGLLFDGCIVYLTFYRGRKQYSSSTADYRRMCGLFFTDSGIDRKVQDYKHGQKLATALGVIMGGFLFILYIGSIEGSEKHSTANAISLLVFCVSCSVLCVLLYKLYRRVVFQDKVWKDEAIYQMWRRIWEQNGFDENGIKKKLQNLALGKTETTVELNQENLQEMIHLLGREETKREFLRYLYPEVISVLSLAQIRRVFSVLYQVNTKSKKTQKIFEEFKYLPCIDVEIVKKYELSTEFNILMSNNIISSIHMGDDSDGKEDTENGRLCYVLPEKFWGLLYDIILIRISGTSVVSFDLEADLLDYTEDKEYED